MQLKKFWLASRLTNSRGSLLLLVIVVAAAWSWLSWSRQPDTAAIDREPLRSTDSQAAESRELPNSGTLLDVPAASADPSRVDLGEEQAATKEESEPTSVEVDPFSLPVDQGEFMWLLQGASIKDLERICNKQAERIYAVAGSRIEADFAAGDYELMDTFRASRLAAAKIVTMRPSEDGVRVHVLPEADFPDLYVYKRQSDWCHRLMGQKRAQERQMKEKNETGQTGSSER